MPGNSESESSSSATSGPSSSAVALTVAGLDPTGTSGMAADLRTFAAFGVHGLAVASLVTSQTTAEFRGAAPMSPEVVLSQLEALLDDVEPAAAKVAMLWSMPIASVVADVAESGRLNNLVVDPVLADGSGRRIVDQEVDEIYRRRLLPAATVATPNWVEAGFLLGREIGLYR